MVWINASLEESGAITAPNKEMKDIISLSMQRIADEPLYIIEPFRGQACYIYSLRSLLDSNKKIRIICKDTLEQLYSSDIDELPCEPKIITKNFLQEQIWPFQNQYLGYNESFFSGLTRGQFLERENSLQTNLTFCANQSMYSKEKKACENFQILHFPGSPALFCIQAQKIANTHFTDR